MHKESFSEDFRDAFEETFNVHVGCDLHLQTFNLTADQGCEQNGNIKNCSWVPIILDFFSTWGHLVPRQTEFGATKSQRFYSSHDASTHAEQSATDVKNNKADALPGGPDSQWLNADNVDAANFKNLPNQNQDDVSDSNHNDQGNSSRLESESESKHTSSLGSSVLCTDMGVNEWPTPIGTDFVPIFDLPLHKIMRRRSHQERSDMLARKMQLAIESALTDQTKCKAEKSCAINCEVYSHGLLVEPWRCSGSSATLAESDMWVEKNKIKIKKAKPSNVQSKGKSDSPADDEDDGDADDASSKGSEGAASSDDEDPETWGNSIVTTHHGHDSQDNDESSDEEEHSDQEPISYPMLPGIMNLRFGYNIFQGNSWRDQMKFQNNPPILHFEATSDVTGSVTMPLGGDVSNQFQVMREFSVNQILQCTSETSSGSISDDMSASFETQASQQANSKKQMLAYSSHNSKFDTSANHYSKTTYLGPITGFYGSIDVPLTVEETLGQALPPPLPLPARRLLGTSTGTYGMKTLIKG